MNYPPIELPDDPREALLAIAAYLRTVEISHPRAHYMHHSGGKRELYGYWQTPEWCEGLVDVAVEAERVAELLQSSAKPECKPECAETADSGKPAEVVGGVVPEAGIEPATKGL